MADLQGEAKHRYVVEMFSRIARRYDLMNTLITGGLHYRWKSQAARLATQGLSGAALDVATGTGDLGLAVARCPSVDRVVAVDLLPQMLALARQKAGRNGADKKMTFLAGNALGLPFPDSAFACVTAGFSLRNMTDLKQALAEMVRVVRPGGRVTTLELSPMKDGMKAAAIRLYFHRLVPLLGQLITGNRAAYTYLPQSVDHFLEADSLADLFREVGLTEVGYRRVGFGAVAVHWGVKPLEWRNAFNKSGPPI